MPGSFRCHPVGGQHHNQETQESLVYDQQLQHRPKVKVASQRGMEDKGSKLLESFEKHVDQRHGASTNTYLKSVLTLSLDEWNPKLCVKILFGAFCRAFDKTFSLSANYPREFSQNFLKYMLEHHPTFTLYHVACCCGARMDMILEATVPSYMNRVVCIEYLDYCLKIVGKKRGNILMQNL